MKEISEGGGKEWKAEGRPGRKTDGVKQMGGLPSTCAAGQVVNILKLFPVTVSINGQFSKFIL